MLRELALVCVAAATLGATTLIPSEASAHGKGNGNHMASAPQSTKPSGKLYTKPKQPVACLECKPRPEKHERHRHHFSPFFFAGSAYYDNYYDNYEYDSCFVRRLVWTPYGYKYRLIDRCS